MHRAGLKDLMRRAEQTIADIEKLHDGTADVEAITDGLVAKALRATPIDGLRPYLPTGSRIGGLKTSRYRYRR